MEQLQTRNSRISDQIVKDPLLVTQSFYYFLNCVWFSIAHDIHDISEFFLFDPGLRNHNSVQFSSQLAAIICNYTCHNRAFQKKKSQLLFAQGIFAQFTYRVSVNSIRREDQFSPARVFVSSFSPRKYIYIYTILLSTGIAISTPPRKSCRLFSRRRRSFESKCPGVVFSAQIHRLRTIAICYQNEGFS